MKYNFRRRKPGFNKATRPISSDYDMTNDDHEHMRHKEEQLNKFAGTRPTR